MQSPRSDSIVFLLFLPSPLKMNVLCAVFLLLISSFFLSPSQSSTLHPLAIGSEIQHRNYTAISEFRLLNRRSLLECPDVNSYLQITVESPTGAIGDDELLNVTVSGVLLPLEAHWVAMISPANSDISNCPFTKALYVQTGDLSDLPLLCHYPVKAQYVSNDPGYLSCSKSECKKLKSDGTCLVKTCSASLSFHVVNIRTDIEFVLFTGGFKTPCILKRTNKTLPFANPKQPLYAHLSSMDSTGTSMKVAWISGDESPQKVVYKDGNSETSKVNTFTQDDMCRSGLPNPAQDFGWHDPGYIHSAVMTGLQPSTSYSYKYGSDSAGWSNEIQFKTPPTRGSEEVKFLAFGDMGKAPRDASVEHYIQPGSISVVDAMTEEVRSGSVDVIFHIGDISYATGFLVEWDYFLHLISPIASKIPYMTAIGNHERDYIGSGSHYVTPDSGGECGVAYENYFPMPTQAKDKPWYSMEYAGVHFTIMSTEHDWSQGSEQYQWMQNDMASINRSATPWLVFTGHRPMYSSCMGHDDHFLKSVEPLLLQNKVDLALFGHVHNYERTCSVYQSRCTALPDGNYSTGIDTYDHRNYTSPVHLVIGMAGFKLDEFPEIRVNPWSLIRIAKFGYLRGYATRKELKLEFVDAKKKGVEDSFRIIK